MFLRERDSGPSCGGRLLGKIPEVRPLLQPQTLLETILHAMQQVVADATGAVMGAFQEGSPERMQLALEHLRKALPRPTDAGPTRGAQAQDLLDAYADPSLHPDIERIARVMTSKAYKNGHCYASQEKIARWTRLPKSTLQLRLHEMERLELIRVERRPGTSSITLFADGTLDALRLKKINKIGTRERINPLVTRTFTTPTLQNVDDQAACVTPLVNSWPKNTSCSENHSTPISLDIKPDHSTHSDREKPVGKSFHAHDVNKFTNENEQKRLVQKGQSHESITLRKLKEEKEKPTSITISKRSPLTASQQQSQKILIEQGVSCGPARSFALLFDHDHIARTIALGIHCEKRNPPAYLLQLIRDDAVSKHIVPDSEADLARRRERPPTLYGRYEPIIPAITIANTPKKPIPCPIEHVVLSIEATEADQCFAALTVSEKAIYQQCARQEVLRANPWLGDGVQSTGPLMEAMIRRQLRIMLRAETKHPQRADTISGVYKT